MKARVQRTIGCLLIVLLGYLAYAVVAVPLLEPTLKLIVPAASSGVANVTARPRTFESLFAEGAWELDSPKVLETDRGTLIFDDYQALSGSRMQLNRCTLIFQAGGSQGKPSRPIVMRATEGAMLFFDGELNIPRGEFGRLVGGELSGAVTIYSPPEEGADDGVEIKTRDIRIDERRIWTPRDVTFRYGPNSGQGGDLSIIMHPPAKSPSRSRAKTSLGRVKSLELVRVDAINLVMPATDLAKLQADGGPASVASSKQPTPVEIHCRGSLKFDFDESVLSLNDHVDILRHNADGPSDQINCQQLLMYFASAGGAVAGDASPKVTDLKLQPSKIVALGFPVIVRADSWGAFARGERLEYDFAKQRIWMQDREVVVLGDANYEVRSKELEYELDPAGLLGRLWAAGPGRIRGRLGQEQRNFESTWMRELRLQPFNGSKVLSLVQAAQVFVEGAGRISADELHLFLIEQPASPNSPRVHIAPDRMKAVGQVRFNSPRVEGTLREANIWFAQEPPKEQSPNGSSAASPPRPSLFANANANEPATSEPVQRFRVSAEQLNAEIQLGDAPQLIQLAARGGVQFAEIDAPSHSSMSLEADLFQVLEGHTPNPIATIVGTPARVAMRGAVLVGPLIELQQGANLATVQGPGQMTLPRPQSPDSPWFVEWQRRMQFDGQQVTFDGQVIAKGMQPMRADDQLRFNVSGESLLVTLTNRVDFQRTDATKLTAPDDRDEIGLRELRFQGLCSLQSETLDPRGLRKSTERMEIRDLRLDQVTGVLHGEGPGWLTSVHQGQDMFKEGQFATTPKGLHFLRVDFQRELVGSMSGRQMEFLGGVQCVYGPVADWEQPISTSQVAQLGPRDVVVTSQRLALADMGQTQDRFDAIELEATGNAFVRGQTFTAAGQRISYVKSKDQLVLEGDGRNYATLNYQRTAQAAPAPLKARKILFWPETKQFELNDFHSLELQNLSQFRGLDR